MRRQGRILTGYHDLYDSDRPAMAGVDFTVNNQKAGTPVLEKGKLVSRRAVSRRASCVNGVDG